MSEVQHTVIITDLDGTLLDRDTYSYRKAMRALYEAKNRSIPIVFCSSKTRLEQAGYRAMLGIADPFIVEDGGAVLIEEGTFQTDFTFHHTIDNYYVIELGTPYEVVRRAIETVRAETGIRLKGYGDMTVAEVAEITGLDRAAAALAMEREYQETLVSRHTPAELEVLISALAHHDLRLSRGGRFLAVAGPHDKGAAVNVLAALYRGELGDVRMVGIGDSHNDLPMFSAVDVPVLVQKEQEVWEQIEVPNLFRVDGVGPEGWNRFVLECVTNSR